MESLSMAAKISVLGRILTSSPYLRSAIGHFPFAYMAILAAPMASKTKEAANTAVEGSEF